MQTKTDFTTVFIKVLDAIDMPNWALPVLINGDTSAVDPEDEGLVTAFERRIQSQYGHAASMTYDVTSEYANFCYFPEFGLGCDCYTTDVWVNTPRLHLDNHDVRTTDVPRSGQTVTGYGSKVPTSKMININNRWYRVYCTIYSNVGTCWIQTKNGRVIVD